MSDPLESLRSRGSLQDVRTDERAVSRLLDDAALHLRTARAALDAGDLSGAYQLTYDAGRKSLTSLLLSRGLRPRGAAAHVTLIDASRTILAGRPGVEVLDRFDRMRRTRNRAEYVGHDFDRDDVLHDLAIAESVVLLVAPLARLR